MWRAIVLSPLGNFEVVRPVQYVFARETYIEFQNYGETTYDGVFDFSVGFSPATAVGVMPVLPIAFDYPVLDLSGGRTFFDIPDLSEAYGYAVFHHATAEITDSIKFTPVPEPSTYALGGVAVLGLTLWWRHAVESRKRNRTIRV
jgi:PEP-CTERM motif